MFSLALADLLVGIALIPQVIREDWIGREMEKNTNRNGTFTFPETECRFLHLYHLCILNFLQDTFWNDLAQCHHLHIHLHYDLHSKVFHGLIIAWLSWQDYHVEIIFIGLSCTTTRISLRIVSSQETCSSTSPLSLVGFLVWCRRCLCCRPGTTTTSPTSKHAHSHFSGNMKLKIFLRYQEVDMF